MLLSFDAKQKLKLSVTRNKEYLSKYLLEEERVVGAMLDSKKLVPEGVGRYKYTVTSFKVFQLDINPVVSIAVENKDGILKMSALESTLDGLGMIDDFNLILKANLEATDIGLEGEALLGVSVSQPPSTEASTKENFGIYWSFGIKWDSVGYKVKGSTATRKRFFRLV